MAEGVGDLNMDNVADHRDVRQKLQETALDLGQPGVDDLFGHGLVQVTADAPPSPTFIEVVAGRKKKELPDSYPTILLDKGIFDLYITNDSLTSMTVKVLKNGQYKDNLEEYIRFGNKDPQEVVLTIHARGQTFVVEFIPAGRPGSFATVEVEQQE